MCEHAMQRRSQPGTSVVAQFVNTIILLRSIKEHNSPLEKKYYSDTLKFYGLEESKTIDTEAKFIVK